MAKKEEIIQTLQSVIDILDNPYRNFEHKVQSAANIMINIGIYEMAEQDIGFKDIPSLIKKGK